MDEVFVFVKVNLMVIFCATVSGGWSITRTARVHWHRVLVE